MRVWKNFESRFKRSRPFTKKYNSCSTFT